ncbi:MAG: drug/metabolite transporter (DMT)-like permease [Paracoccaceae bacterium]|jgi:drug/metabolite transporter (DMT)-like permease
MRLFVLTTFAMLAFAANSVLTRIALLDDATDPLTFAAIRVFAGVIVLWLLVGRRGVRVQVINRATLIGALSLTTYVLGFSLAYRTLDAGLGALVLFGGVQITMFAGAVIGGAAVPILRWIGAVVALSGLCVLFWPSGDAAIDLWGGIWMVAAALGWGIYSLNGRGATDPLIATAANFLFALPVVALPMIWHAGGTSGAGVVLAVISGGITSGLGYALWYSVMPALGATRAAVAQLSVPIIAIVAGVLLLAEPVTARLAMAGLLVIVGIAISLLPRNA